MAAPRRAEVPLTDAALACGLLALGLAEQWLGGEPSALTLVATVVGTVPLALRRRWPLPVLGVTVLGLTLLTVQRSDTFAVAQLLGLMLAAYTVGALEAPVRGGGGLGVLLVAAYGNSAAASSTSPGDYVFATILLSVPWLAGLGMKRWRERAAELEQLASQLAAERDQHARLVVAAERGRIARDLHDSLAQTLNAVVVHAEAADAALGHDDTQARHSLDRIRSVSRDALLETRQLLGQLRGDVEGAGPPRLADVGRLVEASRSQGLGVELQEQGEPGPLPAGVDAAAYRIIQEALTNAARHAPGSTATVRIQHGRELVLEISNGTVDGEPVPPGTGYGLVGMRERATLAGGDLAAGLTSDGFLVTARLPAGGPR